MEMDSLLNSTVVLTDVAPEAISFLSQEEPRIFWLDMRNKMYEKTGNYFEEVCCSMFV